MWNQPCSWGGRKPIGELTSLAEHPSMDCVAGCHVCIADTNLLTSKGPGGLKSPEAFPGFSLLSPEPGNFSGASSAGRKPFERSPFGRKGVFVCGIRLADPRNIGMLIRNGCGSKLNRRGYADFGLCFHLPGFHFGTGFLSHSQIKRELTPGVPGLESLWGFGPF